MKKTYSAIVQQIETLQREAESLRQAEIKGVVDRIKEAIKAYGLTAPDLFGSGGAAKRGRKPGVKAPKAAAVRKRTTKRVYKSYRDGAGNEWGGRGPRPQWLRDALASGKQLSDFLV